MPEHLWELQPEENAKLFAAFELYRQLGPTRTVEEAWRFYWAQSHPGRSGPVPRVMPYFSEWSRRHNWPERARAWDAEQAQIERDRRLDRELQAKAHEHEEDLRQRNLMREEARAARTTGRRMLMRLLQGIDAGQLEKLGVLDLLPHLQRIGSLLEVGQKLDRLYAGEPTEVIRQEEDRSKFLVELVGILKEFVPPERWAELLERIDALEEDA